MGPLSGSMLVFGSILFFLGDLKLRNFMAIPSALQGEKSVGTRLEQ